MSARESHDFSRGRDVNAVLDSGALIAIDKRDRHVLRAAEASGVRGDCVEDGLELRGRAGDRTEHVGRRGLLL